MNAIDPLVSLGCLVLGFIVGFVKGYKHAGWRVHKQLSDILRETRP